MMRYQHRLAQFKGRFSPREPMTVDGVEHALSGSCSKRPPICIREG
jgi:hypothetical protein